MIFWLIFCFHWSCRQNKESMEDKKPYIEIVPCKEEEATSDSMKLGGKVMSDFAYNIYL